MGVAPIYQALLFFGLLYVASPTHPFPCGCGAFVRGKVCTGGELVNDTGLTYARHQWRQFSRVPNARRVPCLEGPKHRRLCCGLVKQM